MKVKYTLDKRYVIPKNTFIFTLETMTGDGDDYHNIEIAFEKEDEIKELVVAAKTAIEMRWDAEGRLFEKYFAGDIHSYEGCNDCPMSYKIVWYDADGKRFNVTATIDAEMQLQIANPDVSNYEYDE